MNEKQESRLLQENLEELNSQKPAVEKDKQVLKERVDKLEKELLRSHQASTGYSLELKDFRQKLSQKSTEAEEKAKVVNVLNKQVTEARNQQNQLSKQKEELQISTDRKTKEIEENKQLIHELEERSRSDRQQTNEFKSLLHDRKRGTLNDFERNIVDTLENTQKVKSSAWRILTQMDVSPNNLSTATMFTDCIVVGSSFVVIIEAKGYSGKIIAEGDTKNSHWLAIDKRGEAKQINSSHHLNPYLQVQEYMNNARDLLKKNISFSKREEYRRISFYQIVVFRDDADLSGLERDLSQYSKIINLESLVDTIHDLERVVRSFSQKNGRQEFSSGEIEDYLRGRPVRKTN